MKKKYDLCLHVGLDDWLADFYLKVYEYFRNRGISVLLITFNKEHQQFFEHNKFDDYLVIDKCQALPIDETLKVSHSLGFPSLQSLYRTEKCFFDVSENYYRTQVSEYFAFLISIKDQYDIKEFITYEGDELEHNIYRAFAKMIGGELSYFGYSNYNVNLHFHNDEMRYYFIPEQHRNFNEDISENDKAEIKKYIQSYTFQQPKLWGDPKKFDIDFKLKYLQTAAKKLRELAGGNIKDERFSFGVSSRAYLKRFFRRTGASKFYEKHTIKSYGDRDLYFFPMHVPNDSQLTQRGLPFYNQLNLIEIISSYLPFPAKLIVKEHPNGRGFYDLGDLKKISEFPNVILVPPDTNSHDIIKQVKAIFVINSSVGFESLFYQKPVVTFGRSFYRDLGLTLDVDSLYDVETVFDKIAEFEVPYLKLEQFIFKLMKLTYPINMYDFNKDNYKEKVDAYAGAIYDYMFITQKHTLNVNNRQI